MIRMVQSPKSWKFGVVIFQGFQVIYSFSRN
ncbi:hypothetical protein [Sicyoidochytrium minutum DNA virus]|nr:hypothetical protein [Sicyoidochytrium minutum DNA virus]